MVNYLHTDIDFTYCISEFGIRELRRLREESKTNPEQFAMDKFFIDYNDDRNFITLDFMTHLIDAGLQPYYALVFNRQTTENDAQGPHVDAQPDGIFVALNWAESDGPERMIWYETDEQGVMPVRVPVHDTLPYIPYDKRQVTEIESTPTVGDAMTLVRTDIPHDIDSKQERISVSLRFHNKWNTWEEAQEFFKGIKI